MVGHSYAVGVRFRYPKSAYIIAKHVLHLHYGHHEGQDKANASHEHLCPSSDFVDHRIDASLYVLMINVN